MKTFDYWEQFLSTGRIDDYLTYREKVTNKSEEDMGVNPDAGTSQCYRDDFKNRTNR